MLKIFLRVFAYLLLATFMAELMRWEALNLTPGRQYSEYGYTEWTQSVFLLICIFIVVLRGRVANAYQQLATCMAVVFGLMLIRENDQLFELFFVHGVWKYFAAILALFGMVYVWKNRIAVARQLNIYSNFASFGIMISGFIVLAFSRLFGRHHYWQTIMGEDYVRVVKNAAEEGVEFMGLGLILIATIEFWNLSEPTAE